jgi:ribose transport system ATP-binding protein
MLGAVEKQKLFAIVRRLRQQGTAFVFITHHIEEVFELGDVVSIMKDGALLETFPLSPDVTADGIVEKLAGRKVSRLKQARRITEHAEPVLRIADLPARHRGSMDLVVRRGEIVGLYGVVGCGRERMARAVVGLDEVGGSPISLAGTAFSAASPAHAAKAGIAYLPAGRADNCVLPTLSIRENLTLTQLGRFRRGGIVAAGAERAAAVKQLSWLRVKYADEEDPVLALSGGNQQKVLIGRAVGLARKLLVLEDPTAGIDVAAKREIHELIRSKADSDGLAVLLLSSDLLETLFVCDSLYTVFKGRLVRRYEPLDESMYQDVIADVLGSDAQRRVPGPNGDRPSCSGDSE